MIWIFKERLIQANASERIFEAVNKQMSKQGSSIVQVSKHSLNKDEKALVAEGSVPIKWSMASVKSCSSSKIGGKVACAQSGCHARNAAPISSDYLVKTNEISIYSKCPQDNKSIKKLYFKLKNIIFSLTLSIFCEFLSMLTKMASCRHNTVI